MVSWGGIKADQKGITVAELIVALAIGALVISAAIAFLVEGTDIFKLSDTQMEAQQKARITLRQMEKDLKSCFQIVEQTPYSLTLRGITVRGEVLENAGGNKYGPINYPPIIPEASPVVYVNGAPTTAYDIYTDSDTQAQYVKLRETREGAVTIDYTSDATIRYFLDENNTLKRNATQNLQIQAQTSDGYIQRYEFSGDVTWTVNTSASSFRAYFFEGDKYDEKGVYLGHEKDEYRSYLRFPISRVTGNIVSATLNFYAEKNQGNSGPNIVVDHMPSDLTLPPQGNYNTEPAVWDATPLASNIGVLVQSSDTAVGWKVLSSGGQVLNIAPLLAEDRESGSFSGYRIRTETATNGKNVYFTSSDSSTSYKPYLSVAFEPFGSERKMVPYVRNKEKNTPIFVRSSPNRFEVTLFIDKDPNKPPNEYQVQTAIVIGAAKSYTPEEFSLKSPANNESNASVQPVLEWYPTTVKDGCPVEYRVVIEGPGFSKSSDWISVTSWSPVSGTEALSPDTTYTWYVEARDKNHWVKETVRKAGPWSFTTTRSPEPPTLSSPQDGATGLPVSPTLYWNTSTDPDGDTLYYQVQVDDNSDFSSPILSGWLSGTSWSVQLDYGTTYWWRVRAKDDKGAVSRWSSEVYSGPSGLRRFTTEEYTGK